MGWPVAWLKRMISAQEFDLWCRYYQRNPFDDESVHHLPTALLTSIYVNANRRQGAAPKSASDFLVFRMMRKAAEPKDLDSKFRAYFSAYRSRNNPSA